MIRFPNKFIFHWAIDNGIKVIRQFMHVLEIFVWFVETHTVPYTNYAFRNGK